MRGPQAATRFATAGAFRRQAVNTGTPFALRARLLPFGDGNTNRVCAGMERSEAGESEYWPATVRSEASRAPFSRANRSAESSFQR